MSEIKEQRIATYFTKLIAVSVGHFFNDMYMNLIPPILFLFVHELGLSLSQQAFIAFIITSSGSFTQPIIGYFVDKRGKSWLVILSVVWISFWMSVSGIITNYYLLVAVLGLGALGSALFHPLGSSIAVKLGKKSMGKSLSIFMTIGGFATSVSPMIAIPVVKTYGLKILVYFMIPGILASFFLYLAQIHKIEVNKPQIKGEEKRDKLDFNSLKWVSALIFISSNKVLIKSFLITFGAQIMLLKHIDINIAGIVLSVYLLVNSLGTIIGGYLNDIIGSKLVLVISNSFAFICMIIIGFTSGISMIVGLILIGLALSSSNTANVVITHGFMPKNLNLATGLILGLSGGLGGFLMLLFGKIADMQGLITGTYYLSIPLILMILISVLLPIENCDSK